jgi:hypothetical protein
MVSGSCTIYNTGQINVSGSSNSFEVSSGGAVTASNISLGSGYLTITMLSNNGIISIGPSEIVWSKGAARISKTWAQLLGGTPG